MKKTDSRQEETGAERWCNRGTEFLEADPAEVRAFLEDREFRKISCPPDRFHCVHDGRTLALQHLNGKVREFPLRFTFLCKLLRWHALRVGLLRKLSIDTVSSIVNDLLLSIRREPVTVTVENGDALTITGSGYSEIRDIDVIDLIHPYGIHSVWRTDFSLLVRGEERAKLEPVPGDLCGFGFTATNSETGFRVLSAGHYILRYICTNGAVVRSGGRCNRWVHSGLNINFVMQSVSELFEHGQAEWGAISRGIAALRRPLERRRLDSIRYSLLRVTGARGANRMLRGIAAGESSEYDLFNAITRGAKEFGADVRLRIEEIAGEMVEGKFRISDFEFRM